MVIIDKKINEYNNGYASALCKLMMQEASNLT